MKGHLPRKRFGQHFLTDSAIIDAIVAEIDPRPGQRLIEIGPGLGAMTHPVARRCGHLTVIELDRDLAAKLRRRDNLDVIEADVLRVNFRDLAGQSQPPAASGLRIFGNLPYNISTPILIHLVDVADRVVDQHFMLQKEVVDRIVSAPGRKDYGRLSVLLQWRYHMEQVLQVPPEAFEPPPRVESAVIRMLPWPQPEAVDRALLEELVAVAFSQRRKLLRHTLGRWLVERGVDEGFDVQRRAEEVSVTEYISLAKKIGSESIFAPKN